MIIDPYIMIVCINVLYLYHQTGLTPLMEAASGGYHEVGYVLISKVSIDLSYEVGVVNDRIGVV